jgi:hypothetical protein
MSINVKELVEQLKTQQLLKRDMVVPSSCLSYKDGQLVIRNVSKNPQMDDLLKSTGVTVADQELTSLLLKPLEAFNRQIAGRFDIPYQYYKKLMEKGNIALLDHNVNHWFSQSAKNYLVRCFASTDDNTGIVRAILGDRYRILDNLDVLMASLDAVRQSGVNIQIESADITDTKMYVRFIAPDVVRESPSLLKNYRVPNKEKGNDYGIHAGFILTNSETGHGSSFVAPRLVVAACRNGMIMKQDATNKVHLGGKMDEGKIDWSEETKTKNVELIIAQVKDAVKMYTSNEYLGQTIDKLEGNGTLPLSHPIDAITNISRDLNFSEDKQKDLLAYFMQSSDLTGFGVAQAVTFFAHSKSDADEQFELEAVAMDIVTNINKYDKPAVAIKKTTQKGFSKN